MNNSPPPIALIRIGLFGYVSYTTYKTFPTKKFVNEAITTAAELQSKLQYSGTSYIDRVSREVFLPLHTARNAQTIRQDIRSWDRQNPGMEVEHLIKLSVSGVAGYYAVKMFDNFRRGFF
ncbi:hypothetical protein TrLO_g13855 [Triparma laevis f. longispina]|uniref:Uncharacterized protein n=1 Tax=Triparma laevis f. longispina TaxID=1714387 RepID=A0A9W7ECU9_9STRA|nr:hypothetical protein TrLO_g13855 [Triparma laevis f. longispina]